MSEYEAAPGDHVLIRGRVADDGVTVIIAPGVELPARSVRIETDIPKVEVDEGQPAAFLLLVFATAEDRQDFADTFADVVETRNL